MTAKKWLKAISTLATATAILGILVWFLVPGNKGQAGEGKEEASQKEVSQASRISVVNGERVITLDHATQLRNGIVVAAIKPFSLRGEVRAYGTILELQNLVGLRKTLVDLRKNLVDGQNNYAAARGQVERTETALAASRKQYERLKRLYQDDRNVSDKALQAGEASFRMDETNVRVAQEGLTAAQKTVDAAHEALKVLEDTARQQWGEVLTRWLHEEPLSFERLIQQRDLLVQITLPPSEGLDIASPETGWIEGPSGHSVEILFISPSPRTDPHVQGMSFFYKATGAGRYLLPGMSVIASLPGGGSSSGFIVPSSAIVWWLGKAWVYVQRKADHFVRRELPPGTPTENGRFVRQGFTSGERIVVRGAQLLLSEELKTQIQVLEEGEKK